MKLMFDVIQNRRVLFGNGKTALIPELIREVTDKKILILAFSETAKQKIEAAGGKAEVV